MSAKCQNQKQTHPLQQKVYCITSSATANSDCGTVSPNARATVSSGETEVCLPRLILAD
jgi:hypothetical protein